MRNKNVVKDFDFKQWEEPQTPTNSGFKNVKDLKFGKLTIKLFAGVVKNGSTWHCLCDCGNWVLFLRLSYIRSGTKSCGCLHTKATVERENNHNMTETSEYYSWVNMKTRCYNKNSERYYSYGQRNISVCQSWLDKKNGFMNFF